MNNIILKICAVFTGLFGLISLFMTSCILLDLFGIREKEGNYVLFIVYANFICSFIYLFCAYGLFAKKDWTTTSLFVALAILIAAYVGLILHIHAGRPFEMRTVKVMLARTAITILLAGISWYYISRLKLMSSPGN